MNKQEFLNTKYLSLCQQLGDSIVKLEQLQSHINNLKSEIEALNKSFTHMSELEALSKAKESKGE